MWHYQDGPIIIELMYGSKIETCFTQLLWDLLRTVVIYSSCQKLTRFMYSLTHLSDTSLCQRLDSRQLTQKTSTEGARKIEREARARAPKAREKFLALYSYNAHTSWDKLKLFGLWHRLLRHLSLSNIKLSYRLEVISNLYRGQGRGLGFISNRDFM